MRLTLILFGGLLQQLLLLEALACLTEMTVLAWGDQRSAINLAEIIIIVVLLLISLLSIKLFGLEILIVEVEFEVGYQWRVMLLLLFLLDLCPGLQEHPLMVSLLRSRVMEEELRRGLLLMEATSEELIVEAVGRGTVYPKRCPWMKTLSLHILGVRIVGRGPSRLAATA